MNFKIIITGLLLCNLCINNAMSQSYATIDEASIKAPSAACKNVNALADYLNTSAKTDMEKVRAYYVWMTNNVNYDTKTFFSGNPNPKTAAADVLKQRVAICQGYATLFKALCDYSNIKCEIVSGYSKGYGFDARNKLSKSDHAWNAVFINEQWHLLDVTWGAGYIDNQRKFVSKFTNEFFLPDAKVFILKHLPTDPMWQLLPCPITIDDYLKSDAEISATIELCDNTAFNFNDTISEYIKLNPTDQQIVSAERAFRFNPKNFEVAGFAYLNLGYELSQTMPQLYASESYAKALELSNEILDINKRAYYFLNKGNSDQAKNAANICKQNIEAMHKNIKSLKDFVK